MHLERASSEMLEAPCDLSGNSYELPDQEDIMMLDCGHSCHSDSSPTFEVIRHTEFELPYPSPFSVHAEGGSSHHSDTTVMLDGDDLDSVCDDLDCSASTIGKWRLFIVP